MDASALKRTWMRDETKCMACFLWFTDCFSFLFLSFFLSFFLAAICVRHFEIWIALCNASHRIVRCTRSSSFFFFFTFWRRHFLLEEKRISEKYLETSDEDKSGSSFVFACIIVVWVGSGGGGGGGLSFDTHASVHGQASIHAFIVGLALWVRSAYTWHCRVALCCITQINRAPCWILFFFSSSILFFFVPLFIIISNSCRSPSFSLPPSVVRPLIPCGISLIKKPSSKFHLVGFISISICFCFGCLVLLSFYCVGHSAVQPFEPASNPPMAFFLLLLFYSSSDLRSLSSTVFISVFKLCAWKMRMRCLCHSSRSPRPTANDQGVRVCLALALALLSFSACSLAHSLTRSPKFE